MRSQLGAVACAVVLAGAAVAVAQAPPSSSGRAVARVGERSIGVAELQERLDAVPPYQLRVLGDTPEQIRRVLLAQLVDEELLVQAARRDKVDGRADVESRTRGVLRTALLAALRQQVGDGADLPAAEVAAYYRAHASEYRSDQLLKLWQIVVPTRERAEEVLEHIRTDAEYAKDPIRGWGELAERYSIDEATKQHKGNLDFVRPDGSTKRPEVRVSPALYQAALKVADGQLVAEPIPIDEGFAIVQRRGTRETPNRSLESEAPVIRRKLAQQRYEQQVTELVAELRRRVPLEMHPERLDLLELSVPDGDVVPARRPGGLPRSRHPAAGSPRPAGPPGYLR